MRAPIAAIDRGPMPARPADPVVILASPDPDHGALRATLAGLRGRDLPGLLRRLAHHRVEGLAARALQPMRDAAHPWLRSALRRRRQQQASANLVQGLALAELLESLDRAGVPAAVIGGLRTIEMVYGDAGARPPEPHELLIPAAALRAADAVLRRQEFDRLTAARYRRGGVVIDLRSAPRGGRLWTCRSGPGPRSETGLLARAVPGRVAGAPALLLSAEDEFLLLALRAVRHSFDRLILSADLAHFLARRGALIRGAGLRRRAEITGAIRPLMYALEVAGALGVVPPPDLRFGGTRSLERGLLRRARTLRPLPWCGELLMLLGGRLRLSVDGPLAQFEFHATQAVASSATEKSA